MPDRRRVAIVFTGGTIAMLPDRDRGGRPALRGADPRAHRRPRRDRRGRGRRLGPRARLAPAVRADPRHRADHRVADRATRHRRRRRRPGHGRHRGDGVRLRPPARSDKPVVVVGAMRNAADPAWDGPGTCATRSRWRPTRTRGTAASSSRWPASCSPPRCAQDPFARPRRVPGARRRRHRAGRRRPGRARRARGRLPPFPPSLPTPPSRSPSSRRSWRPTGTCSGRRSSAALAGIVVAATGSGNTDPDLLAAAREAMAAGIPVVLVTPLPVGRRRSGLRLPGRRCDLAGRPGPSWAAPRAGHRRASRSRSASAPAWTMGRCDGSIAGGARSVAAELIVAGASRRSRVPDAGFGWVEAIAIGGGRVVAAGTRADLDRCVVPRPGRGRSRRPRRPAGDHRRAPPSRDAAPCGDRAGPHGARPGGALDAIGAEHARRLAAGDADGWLLGHGWSLDALGGRPSADLLDGVAPGRPVALWSHDHHARWVSGEALRLAHRPRDGSATDGGRIERDEGGSPTGLSSRKRPSLSTPRSPAGPGPRPTGPRRLRGEPRALGVTGVHDPGEVAPDPELASGPTCYRRLARTDGCRCASRPASARAARRRDRAGFRTGRPRSPAPGTRSATGTAG